VESTHQLGDSGIGLNAFMSYARFDDHHDEKTLTQLRKDLSAEVQAQIGLPFTIFQDTEDIGPADDWEARLRHTVSHADFLIPIITPSFLEREWCRREVGWFSDREGQQGVNIIFPV
jgi:TIR domain